MQKGDEHSLSTQWGEEKEYPSSREEMVSKYYFVIKLLKTALFFPPSLFSASQSGGWIPRSASHYRVFSTCKCRRIRTRWGGGVAWVALWRAFSQTQKLVFWWFLRIYLTSAPFSCWYFLLLKQQIFWYYSTLQVMAILCCVARKAASAAQCKICNSQWMRILYYRIFISDRLDLASDPDTHAPATNLSSSLETRSKGAIFLQPIEPNGTPLPTYPPSHTGIYSFFPSQLYPPASVRLM
jgi:hypothetical protein